MADENATVTKAFTQLQNYKNAIPSLFNYNGILIASDGFDAKAGTISSELSRFAAWKSVDGEREDKQTVPQIQTMVQGMLSKDVLLDLLKQFIVFEKARKEDIKTGQSFVVTVKKKAAYHQYYAKTRRWSRRFGRVRGREVAKRGLRSRIFRFFLMSF